MVWKRRCPLLGLAAVLVALGPIPWATPASIPEAPQRPTPGAVLRRHPWRFVRNDGQFDPRVRFQARGPDGALWITDDAWWWTVLAPDKGTAASSDGSAFYVPLASGNPFPPSGRAEAARRPAIGVNLKLSWIGMASGAKWTAADLQPARVNYLQGADASRWRANVPAYATLRWQGVYDGIDLTFGAAGLTVEAVPGADLGRLRLRVEGANAVRLEAGRLVADTAAGPLPLPPLLTADGRTLPAMPEGEVLSFSLPDAGHAAPLVAPATSAAPADDANDLLYGTYLGGDATDGNGDYGQGIAVGADGSAYITGQTYSFNFPTTPGAFDTTYDAFGDVFVSKINFAGSGLVYSTYLGGSGSDCYNRCGIAVSADGTATLAGYTSSPDFPTTPGAFRTALQGSSDAYVTRLSADGTSLAFSTYLGGSNFDCFAACAIAVDAAGAAYVTGDTYSTDFPTTPGAFDTSFNGGYKDAFVAKLNAQGSALVYASYLGGNGSFEEGFAIAVDKSGAAYITGRTESTNFPTTTGAFDPTYNGGTNGDSFVTKIDPSGRSLAYSTYLGGSGDDWGYAIALDSAGNAYVTGNTISSNFPTTSGAYDRTFAGGTCTFGTCPDAFITKVKPDGTGLVFSTFLGDTGYDEGYGIAVGADGRVTMAGASNSSAYPTTPGAFDRTIGGGSCIVGPCFDAVITVLTADGSALTYSTFMGGSDGDYAKGVALGNDGAIELAGETFSTDFPTTPGAFDTTYNGGIEDAFAARLSPDLPVMQVAGIDPRYRASGGRYLLGAGVTISAIDGTAVPTATVTVQLTRPNGRLSFAMGSTDNHGRATVTLGTSQTGTYTFTVTTVAKAGWVYNPLRNAETSDSITIR